MTTENKTTENKTTENKTSENKTSENKTSENKTSENKTSENKTSENKTTENKTSENKTLVGRALAELITTGGVDALEPLLSDDFVHHRPDSTSSTKAQWLAAVREALVPLAGTQVEVVHLLSEGDHVVMHSRRRLPAAGPEIAVVDIWRIEDGLIAEGWEIIEPTARAAANLVWWEPAER